MTEARNRQTGNSLPREIRQVIIDGETLGYKGGKPRTPAAYNDQKKWEPPKNESTPKERPKGKS